MNTKVSSHKAIMQTKIACPSCGSSMTIRNLKYSHKCRSERPPSDVELLVAKAFEAAANAHRVRMADTCVENAGAPE